MRLILPFPVSVNAMHLVANRHLIRSKRYRDWLERTVGYIRAVGNPKMPDDTPLDVEIVIRRPDQRRRDIDNLTKSVLDALQEGGVIGDDCWVWSLAVRWWRPDDDFDLKTGTCRVTVEEIPL